jgi:hypothetical protein
MGGILLETCCPGVHFLWNEAPCPEGHPSIYNKSVPLPDYVNGSDSQVEMALGDSKSRKEWRRKEVHDFMTISKFMLRHVYGNETRPRWRNPEEQRREGEQEEEKTENRSLDDEITNPSTGKNSDELSSAKMSNHSLNGRDRRMADAIEEDAIDETAGHEGNVVKSLLKVRCEFNHFESHLRYHFRNSYHKR